MGEPHPDPPPPPPAMSDLLADLCQQANVDTPQQLLETTAKLLTPTEYEEFLDLVSGQWWPLPKQIIPPEHEWTTLLVEAGRGFGKTDLLSDYIDEHVKGPPCDHRVPGGHRMAMLAPTIGDAYESGYSGPSSVFAHNPTVKCVQRVGGTYLEWPNGASMKLIGGDKPDSPNRLRAGGNICRLLVDEVSSIRYLTQCMEVGDFGIRLGPNPKVVASTTPKNTRAYKDFRTRSNLAMMHGTTLDNPHLPQSFIDAMQERYADTEMGNQELLGQLIDEVKGALFNRTDILRGTIEQIVFGGGIADVVLSVDPSGSEKGLGDEAGIMVTGRGWDGNGYLFDDRTIQGTAGEWADAIVQAFRDTYTVENYQPTVVKVEGDGNMGGLTKELLGKLDSRIPVEVVYTGGLKKAARAKAISPLYEKHRIYHVGEFPKLEDEMCGWVPNVSDYSPNRLDALVYGWWHHFPKFNPTQGTKYGRKRRGR